MINTIFTISGVTYEPKELTINKSMSEFGASSSFTARFDSPFGRHKTDFNVANEVRLLADKDTNPPVTLLFRGILETRTFEGEQNTQEVTLTGRDYTARFMDVTVEPVVYTNSEVSTIVKNIINNEVPEITTNNVNVTTTTLARIAFNHLSVYDALTQLAELSGFIFYIDTNNDLNFKLRNSVSSNQTFNNTNILSSHFDKTRENFVNRVWVYGDRQLTSAPQHVFIQDANLGSVVTLTYKPHNTQVRSSEFTAGSILKGGILNMVSPFSVSGLDYLVNYEDSQIIMVSGTQAGYSRIPPNGGSLVINYDRSVPIAKFKEDVSSINLYGPKEKVIIDKSIKDPLTAVDIVLTELENSTPLDKIELNVKGWFVLTPGQTAGINLSDFNLSGTAIGILDVNYNFNPVSIRNENVIQVSLDNKITDITDEFIELNRRLKRIEAADIELFGVTRLTSLTGSMLIVGSKWIVYTRFVGSSFILGDISIGSILTGTIGPIRLGLLGSSTGSVSFLGDSRSGLSFVTSGGYSGY